MHGQQMLMLKIDDDGLSSRQYEIPITSYEITQTRDSYDVTSFGDRRTQIDGPLMMRFDMTVDKSFTEQQIRQMFGLEDRSNMQYLYQYAVTYTPYDAEGKAVPGESKVLIEPTTMLTSSKQTVERTAARAVVDDGTLNWDYVNIIVVPFGNGR